MNPIQIAGILLLVTALAIVAWPIVREGRSFFGKKRPVRTSIAGVTLTAGAVLLLAPRVVADGFWSLAPDRVLINALADVTDAEDDRALLLKRRIGADALEPAKLDHLRTSFADRLNATDDGATWRFVTLMLDGVEPDDQIISAWLDGLTGESADVRQQAAYALGTFKPDEDRAVAALVDASDHPEFAVRAICAWALMRYSADGELADIGVEGLKGLLFDPAPNVRFQAAAALAGVLDDATPIVGHLIEGLNSPDLLTRLRAIGALSSLGAQARSALPSLEVIRHSDDKSLSLAAEKAIEAIESYAEAE